MRLSSTQTPRHESHYTDVSTQVSGPDPFRSSGGVNVSLDPRRLITVKTRCFINSLYESIP